MPMVYKVGQADNLHELLNDGIIGQPTSGGNFDQYRWYMPKIHAEQNPALLSFYGLRGETNRPKVAEAFKRPTDWGTYCKNVSRGACTVANDVAARAPKDEEEAGKYFADGLYTGHFRLTDENNCTDNPGKCTGHITSVPCFFGNFAVQQAYHLNIPVKSNGPLPPNGGYGYSSLYEIYKAANATGSNVLMYWWEPDAMHENWRGTDYELVPIHLPPPTAECEAHRVPQEGRCSENFTEQVGSPIGSCDAGPVASVVVTTLEDCGIGERARCSPAYSAIRNYDLTNLNLQQIFKYRMDDPNYDGRLAVCRWFAENLDGFKENILPKTYPRQRRDKAFYQPLTYFTLALAVLCMAVVLISAFVCKRYEKTKVMEYAQVDFLLIILAGLFLVAVGALLYSVAPTKAVCVARNWFVAVGYSLELIPLVVKVGTINRIFRQSERMKKVEIKRHKLYQIVGGCIFAICVILAIWTALDPTVPQTKMVFTNESDNDTYIVEVSSFCASSSGGWNMAISVYLLALLLVSTAIATQNRGIREEFNETRYLALMIYSHFMFMILRLVVFLIRDHITWPNVTSTITSTLLSLDTLITIGIYFLPKFIAAKEAIDNPISRIGSSRPIDTRAARNHAAALAMSGQSTQPTMSVRRSFSQPDQNSLTWRFRPRDLGDGDGTRLESPNNLICEDRAEPATVDSRRRQSFTWGIIINEFADDNGTGREPASNLVTEDGAESATVERSCSLLESDSKSSTSKIKATAQGDDGDSGSEPTSNLAGEDGAAISKAQEVKQDFPPNSNDAEPEVGKNVRVKGGGKGLVTWSIDDKPNQFEQDRNGQKAQSQANTVHWH